MENTGCLLWSGVAVVRRFYRGVHVQGVRLGVARKETKYRVNTGIILVKNGLYIYVYEGCAVVMHLSMVRPTSPAGLGGGEVEDCHIYDFLTPHVWSFCGPYFAPPFPLLFAEFPTSRNFYEDDMQVESASHPWNSFPVIVPLLHFQFHIFIFKEYFNTHTLVSMNIYKLLFSY